MADSVIRQGVGQYPVPEVTATGFVRPKPLSECRVAILTTAGLAHAGDESWQPNDQSFRVFERDDRALKLGHLSPNFDRSGFFADINVAYPIDRLEEFEEEGVIGSVAPRHISFMGAIDGNMSTLELDSGPAAAEVLKGDGVDVVLLTPV